MAGTKFEPFCPCPRIGDRVTWVPAVFCGEHTGYTISALVAKVTGTIVYINEAHRFYRVRYKAGGTIQHECFKY